MARLFLYTAAAAFGFASVANGYPASCPGTLEPDIGNPIGFDEALKEMHISEDNIFSDLRVLNDIDFWNQTATDATPLTVDDDELEKRFIVGKDNRHLWTKSTYPFAAVGRLIWSSGVYCSGALVGPRHVLTAKHCLISNATGTFYPGYDNGPRFGSAHVVTAVTTGELPKYSACGTKGDWAVAIIDQRLGDKVGYFGAKYPDSTQFDRPHFTHMGYPGDRDGGNRPYRQTGITVHSKRTFNCDSTGPFYTDTDTAGGQSGGPHWEVDKSGNRWIWGALSITVNGPTGAYAGWASGNQMVETISRLRKEFP